MTPEQRYWNMIRDRIPGHVQRFENAIDRGTPDVNVCHQGIEVWIELKVVENRMVKIRKEQRVWGIRRWKAGGKVYLLSADMKTHIHGVWELNEHLICRIINDTYLEVCQSPGLYENNFTEILKYMKLWN